MEWFDNYTILKTFQILCKSTETQMHLTLNDTDEMSYNRIPNGTFIEESDKILRCEQKGYLLNDLFMITFLIQ